MCCERKIALVCERRRLSGMVVTKRKQHAPVGVGTRQVGALDRIAGTIDTGPLPYHIAIERGNPARSRAANRFEELEEIVMQAAALVLGDLRHGVSATLSV